MKSQLVAHCLFCGFMLMANAPSVFAQPSGASHVFLPSGGNAAAHRQNVDCFVRLVQDDTVSVEAAAELLDDVSTDELADIARATLEGVDRAEAVVRLFEILKIQEAATTARGLALLLQGVESGIPKAAYVAAQGAMQAPESTHDQVKDVLLKEVMEGNRAVLAAVDDLGENEIKQFADVLVVGYQNSAFNDAVRTGVAYRMLEGGAMAQALDSFVVSDEASLKWGTAALMRLSFQRDLILSEDEQRKVLQVLHRGLESADWETREMALTGFLRLPLGYEFNIDTPAQRRKNLDLKRLFEQHAAAETHPSVKSRAEALARLISDNGILTYHPHEVQKQ